MNAAGRRPASRATLFALSLGHGCVDTCSGALIALLPFLVLERHYTWAAAGVFALTASVASAVFQPLLGAHGDRSEAHWLLPTGLIVTGLGIGAVGFATSYPLTLLAVAICSAGVATYHPEGARWARHSAGSRVTADMGIFSMGGTIGYAVGPLVVTATIAPLGLHGTAIIAIIPIAAAMIVAAALRRFRRRPVAEHESLWQARTLASEWRPFAVLLALFCLACGVTTGLLTYVPLFVLQTKSAGTSAGASEVVLSIMLASAAAGTLFGGITAGRLGRRFVLLAPQLALVPAIALLPSLSYAAMIPMVVLIGILMNTNVGVALVLAQEYLPAHMGLATGLTVGLCGGLGGVIVAALGLLGDAAGPSAVIYVLAVLPLAVALLASRLPRPAAAPPGTVWSLRAQSEH